MLRQHALAPMRTSTTTSLTRCSRSSRKLEATRRKGGPALRARAAEPVLRAMARDRLPRRGDRPARASFGRRGGRRVGSSTPPTTRCTAVRTLSLCYLPLYIFCGDFLLCARLRPSNNASSGVVEELERVHAGRRSCRAGLLARFMRGWITCSAWPRPPGAGMKDELAEAKSGKGARLFRSFPHRTLTSWIQGANPRFIVTSLDEEIDGSLCTSASTAPGGQSSTCTRTGTSCTRMNLSAVAYELNALRRLGLRGTAFAATCGTVRTP